MKEDKKAKEVLEKYMLGRVNTNPRPAASKKQNKKPERKEQENLPKNIK